MAEQWDREPSFPASSVNTSLTPKRQIEAPEYARAVRRMVTALGRRVASGDIEGLADLAAMAAHLDKVILETITALRRDHGYSWAEVGRALGVTKQAAQQRWGISEPAPAVASSVLAGFAVTVICSHCVAGHCRNGQPCGGDCGCGCWQR